MQLPVNYGAPITEKYMILLDDFIYMHVEASDLCGIEQVFMGLRCKCVCVCVIYGAQTTKK